MLNGYFGGKINYPGRAGHLKDVIAYIKRTTRLKYEEAALRDVCSMLQSVGNEDKLLTTLTNRGLKLYPKSPFFLCQHVGLELKKGPNKFNAQKNLKCLDKALAAAQVSQNPKDMELIPLIKRMIVQVQDLKEAINQFPFMRRMPNRMPETPEEMQRVFEKLFGGPVEDDFEEEDDFMPMPKRKAPKRKGS
jgi:hypothetical protein